MTTTATSTVPGTIPGYESGTGSSTRPLESRSPSGTSCWRGPGSVQRLRGPVVTAADPAASEVQAVDRPGFDRHRQTPTATHVRSADFLDVEQHPT